MKIQRVVFCFLRMGHKRKKAKAKNRNSMELKIIVNEWRNRLEYGCETRGYVGEFPGLLMGKSIGFQLRVSDFSAGEEE